MCRAVTIQVRPQFRVSAGLVILHKYLYPCGIFYYKEQGYDSAVPGHAAVMDEKLLSPLYPVGEGIGLEGGSGYK